jgi:hypothetical protein
MEPGYLSRYSDTPLLDGRGSVSGKDKILFFTATSGLAAGPNQQYIKLAFWALPWVKAVEV